MFYIRLLLVIASCFLFTGCLVSVTKLIDSKSQVPWAQNDTLLVVDVDRNLKVRTSSPHVRPDIVQYTRLNGRWAPKKLKPQFSFSNQQGASGKAQSGTIAFSIFDNKSNIALLEHDQSRISYQLARKLYGNFSISPSILNGAYDYAMGISSVEFSEEELTEFKQVEVEIDYNKSSNAYSVSSVENLMTIINKKLVPFAEKGQKFSEYKYVRLIAEKPETQKKLSALLDGIECLNRAGHRNDAIMSELNGLAIGTASIADIAVEEALPVCEHAMQQEPFLGSLKSSVAYALARIKQKTGDIKETESFLDVIDDTKYPMKAVMQADMAYRAPNEENRTKAALSILDKALESDNSDIQRQTILNHARARYLSLEHDNPESLKQSREIFSNSVGSNSQSAMLNYALQLKNGVGGPKDEEQSKTLLIELYEANMPEAVFELGKSIYFGELGLTKNLKLAHEIFSEAIEIAPVAEAYYFKGFMEMYGQGVAKDITAGINSLEQAHKRGFIAATGEMGLAIYLRLKPSGLGDALDKSSGLVLLEKAKLAGDANSSQYLKNIDDGIYEQIIKKRAKSATDCSNGDAIACAQAAFMIEYGEGGPMNKETARELYLKACHLQNDYGCYASGVMFSSGTGGEKDLAQAEKYYELACNKNYYGACFNLANQLSRGTDEQKTKAILLFDKACKGKDTRACFNLGIAYHFGNSVSIDFVKALELYTLACNDGVQDACKNIKFVSE